MANNEQTFIMIKPDGVARGLVGEVIKRFEQKVMFLSTHQPKYHSLHSGSIPLDTTFTI